MFVTQKGKSGVQPAITDPVTCQGGGRETKAGEWSGDASGSGWLELSTGRGESGDLRKEQWI